MTPRPTPDRPTAPAAEEAATLEFALEFARADLRWRVLSAQEGGWADPRKRRGLAQAFLRRHAAKLALTLPA